MHLMLDKRIAKAIITSSMIAVIFVRLFLTIAVILFYYEFYRPDGDAFVIPFFIFYLIYMVFENRFLINYSKEIEQG